VFDVLAGLRVDGVGTILDAGCGSGDLALGLLGSLPEVERLDAVDLSPAMIAEGRRRPGGDDLRLRWIVGLIESVELDRPYELITAGESLHWMDWAVVMPRLRDALAPGAVLVIAGHDQLPAPWTGEHLRIVQRYSTNTVFQPYDLIDELARRGLFHALGRATTAPVRHEQSIDDYVESWHSRNGLSRDRMTAEAASGFDRETRELLARHGVTEHVAIEVAGRIVWGLPAPA
jgi:trans-aconitate methyltransferase